MTQHVSPFKLREGPILAADPDKSERLTNLVFNSLNQVVRTLTVIIAGGRVSCTIVEMGFA